MLLEMNNHCILAKLLFLLSIVISMEGSPLAPPSPWQNPNCTTVCAGIDIPYPFGIGPGCFLDDVDWFEIECQGSGASKEVVPVLKKAKLQVINISNSNERGMESRLIVRYPVISDPKCVGNHTWSPVSLSGSPFTSNAYLITVGCHAHALLTTSYNREYGCGTDGFHNASRNGSCLNGTSSCFIDIPSISDEFKVEFTGGAQGHCPYALLTSWDWFPHGNLQSILDQKFSPLGLSWGIPPNSSLASRMNPYHQNYTDVREHGYSCYGDDLTGYLYCSCSYGFRGNPYLGCEDIDECAEEHIDNPMCFHGHKCVNDRGAFHCVDSWRKAKFVLIGIGSALGALLLFFLIWRLLKFIKKRKEIKLRKTFFERNGGLLLQQQLNSPEGGLEKGRIFTVMDLVVATDNFNKTRILGHGGQGTVYKGMLIDGRIVAVKKSTAVDEGMLEQFINEVVILSQINHRNIVKLLGCCLETEVPLLVYEFIPNGTLFEYLHDANEELPVTWETRLRIATEMSGALSYLHSAASIPIYHRDIKSTNILLDEKYRAKVADFGTSKSVSLEQTHVTTLVQGTLGYLDPEYFQTSQFTDKSDVYSFGVVLVELLTGQKPISSSRTDEGRSLATYFIISMEENQLLDILHPQVRERAPREEIERVADVARRCLHLHGRNRPTMREVAAELEEVRNISFPSGIQQKMKRDAAVEEHEDGLEPSLITGTLLASLDERPFLVTTSW